MMPVLPFIEDNEENIARIVALAHESGAAYILPAFGMTLRDRQRAYYYGKLDQHFPGLHIRYQKTFGERYSAPAQNAARLKTFFNGLCQAYEIVTRMPVYAPRKRRAQNENQPRLF